MNESLVGRPLRRVEDERLLTGRGRYLDDLTIPGVAHVFLLRSPHAHAGIRGIDTTAAVAHPGVIAVFTGQDIIADGLGTILPAHMPDQPDGTKAFIPPYRILADGRVRFAGQAVVAVVAETLSQARDAAETIAIDYDTMPAVTAAPAARESNAPLLWDEAPGNRCFLFATGDAAQTDAAFGRAAHVTKLRIVNNRLVPNPMEPRSAIGQYDSGEDTYTLHTGTQNPHSLHRLITQDIFRIPGHRLRVIVPMTGGGFGTKGAAYPEQPLVLWLAKRVGRPVKWVSDRGEAFLTDTHARDYVTDGELALDADGRFLALRVQTMANIGAFVSNHGAVIPTSSVSLFTGVYRIPAMQVTVEGVYTNTTPVDAYRGAGRPEIMYIVERLVDAAAHELGIDRYEIRHRNVLKPNEFPYATPLGWTYDGGAFEKNLVDAARISDWTGFATRRSAAKARGTLLGIGIANHIDRAAGPPNDEFAEIRFDPAGGVTVLSGSMSTGQGHETAFAQIAADHLGVPFASIRLVQGDTALVARGSGTVGSRSTVIGGSAIVVAANRIVAKGKILVAHHFEAAVEDVTFERGIFRIGGTNRTVSMLDVAKIAYTPTLLPPGMDVGLVEVGSYRPSNLSFPNGCHVCEVEIDPETGRLAIGRYVAVDDYGIIVNPLLAEGQVHGAVAQGLGQAFLEHTVYDSSGQLVTGSFMDYAMPRADDVPSYEVAFNVEVCQSNLLGVRGIGESGTLAAPCAVISAVLDALAPLGIHDFDMPATPERVWKAIQAAPGHRR